MIEKIGRNWVAILAGLALPIPFLDAWVVDARTSGNPLIRVAPGALMWAIIIAGVFTMLARVIVGIKSFRKTNPYACPNCGYDLRATPDRCPECGHVRRG